MSLVGRPIPHESAIGHVTGEALYTDDLADRFSDLLHAWPVQSPYAHAEIRNVDARPALVVPGVVTVLTADDLPGENDTGCARRDEALFPSEVTYHGQAVAWVLAETLEAARAGAERVVVDYQELEAILTIEDAIRQGSFHTEPQRIATGDPKSAIARAPHRLRGEILIGGQEHFYLETQAAIAVHDEAGDMLVHSSTQHPSETQEIVARVLGVPKSRVTCQQIRMGGAFGGKEVQANAWAAVAALGTHKTRRPVRVRLDRLRDMALTGKRHPFLARFETGCDEQGRLLGVIIELFSDGGWSLDLSSPVLARALFHVDNAYRIENLDVVGRVAKTHKTSQTAFRGFGGPQGMVVIEEILDRVARTVGLPPHQVRETNLYREGDRTHYGQPVKDAHRLTDTWQLLRTNSQFETRWKEIENFNRREMHRKRGLAITPVKFGISFTTAFFNQAGAFVLAYADGSVQLNHGGTEMGQGLHTKMLQVAADALGVPIEAVRLMPTRTDKIPNTSATAASSGSDLNGAAVKAACETLRARLTEVAARLLGCAADDIEFKEGKVYSYLRPDRSLTFGEITKQAYLARVPLFSTGYYRTPRIEFDEKKGRGKPFHYFAYGAAVSEVEVDGFTGQYRLRRVDIVHDVGDSLSPLVDIGQVEGGFLQGMGWLTLEELVWDSRGQLRTNGASTYKLPSLGECPDEFNVTLLPKATEPTVIHGSKAVGEPPLMLAISVREALRQAVAAFGTASGIVELGCPATAEAVYWAIEHVKQASARKRSAAE